MLHRFKDKNTKNVFLSYSDSFACLLSKGSRLWQLHTSKSFLFMVKAGLYQVINPVIKLLMVIYEKFYFGGFVIHIIIFLVIFKSYQPGVHCCVSH